MRGAPQACQAFGKLQRDEQGRIKYWLPLVDHMTDVAICFHELSQCHSIYRALGKAAERKLTEQDIARLAALVFLHDLGKANSGFQAKRWQQADRPHEWPTPAGHGIEATKIFEEESLIHLVDALPVSEICTWGEAVDSLLKASISHHGRPIIEQATNWNKAIWRPVKEANGIIGYDPLPVMEEMTQRVKILFPQAFSNSGGPLPSAPEFGHLFAGLVQLADWLGSDTRFFGYANEADDRVKTAWDNAENAILTVGLDANSWNHSLSVRQPTFTQTFEIEAPYPIQEAMDDTDLGSLVILESETGSGKTEAALWRYIHLFRTGQVDSLYFALPTRVSATQIYQRVKRTIKRLWPVEPPITVRALPGYAAADNHQAIALPDFKMLWNDDPDEQQAHRRWAAESPKRFLAAPIAVGTIDQALLGILKVRHAHLRYALLSRSLLVVDEVHASDPYMTVLLTRLLKAHLHNGGHALLLSATLGASARHRYLDLVPKGGKASVLEPFDTAKLTPYPAISDFRGLHSIPAMGRTKSVNWSLYDCIDEAEKIAEMAINAANSGAKVLVIRNTVPAAITLLKKLEGRLQDPAWLFTVNEVVTLHHSRFSRQDRSLLDLAIESRLGKKRPDGSCIVIGTQTLEQSLDIDADVLITDLCPMDVLLQRIGRLHRHCRSKAQRPVDYQTAQTWVLTPKNNDLTPMLSHAAHGLGRFRDGGGVYPDLRIIEATHRLIVEHPNIQVPRDNRLLVEGATHPDQLQVIQQEMGDAWEQLGQQIEGDTGAQRTIGYLHTLEIDKEFAKDANMAFPNDHKIATRLGAQDKLVQFEPPLTGPFGKQLRQLPIRHFLLPHGLDPDTPPSAIEHTQEAIIFNLGKTRFCYSRFGLERLNND